MGHGIKVLLIIEVLQVIGLLLFRWSLRPDLRSHIGTRTILLALALPAVAMFCRDLYVFYAYLALVMLVSARNRVELCAAYLLMLPLMPEFAQDWYIGSLYVFQISTTIALGAGALIGLALTAGKRVPKRPALDAAAAGLLLLLAFVEGHGGSPTVYLRTLTYHVLLLGAPYLLISRSVGSMAALRSVLLRFCLAGALASMIAVYEAVNHWSLYETIIIMMDLPRATTASLNIRAGLMRVGGPMLNVTAFGFFLAVALGALIAARPCFRPLGYRVLSVLFLFALVASQSRGAWLAAGAAYGAICLYRRLYSRTFVVAAVSLVAYGVGQLLFGDNQRVAEALGQSGGSAGTAEYRKQLFSLGMEQVRMHPLIGQSVESLNTALASLIQGQGIIDYVNAHLYVAMRAGVLGFAVWLLVWAAPLKAVWRSRLRSEQRGPLASLPIALIVTSMVGLAFTSHVNRTLVWPTLGLGFAVACSSLLGGRAGAGAGSRRPLIGGMAGGPAPTGADA